MSARYVLYPTVLPVYRTECVSLLREALGGELALYASLSHLDPSVRTGIPEGTYHRTPLVRLAGRLYLQLGGWREALAAESLVVDLNPRSLSNWVFLLARGALGRRTVLWGHLHPRAGAASRTAALRRRMLRAADGFVAYTPGQAEQARVENPGHPVWVASNALYTRDQLLRPVPSRARRDVLYVGRLEAEKRVDLLVSAFARHAATHHDSRLVLVGAGSDEQRLRDLVRRSGLDERVVLAGWVDDVDRLREHYASAFCSVSPGFAGLGLTQSLGFGVPQVVADDPVHSPEIELARVPGAVRWFDGTSVASLADQLDLALGEAAALPREDLREVVVEHFAAESMAEGLRAALTDGATRA